jgi:hypothetical protein
MTVKHLGGIFGRNPTFNDVTIDGGIYFEDGQAGNLLNDYEEGTFTFTLRDATSGGNVSPTTGTARYTKIGRIVHIELQSAVGNIDTTGMTSGNTLYFDLPFAKGIGLATGSCVLGNFTFPAGFSVFTPEAFSGSVGLIRMSGDNVGTLGLRVSDITSGATDIIRLTLTYTT